MVRGARVLCILLLVGCESPDVTSSDTMVLFPTLRASWVRGAPWPPPEAREASEEPIPVGPSLPARLRDRVLLSLDLEATYGEGKDRVDDWIRVGDTIFEAPPGVDVFYEHTYVTLSALLRINETPRFRAGWIVGVAGSSLLYGARRGRREATVRLVALGPVLGVEAAYAFADRAALYGRMRISATDTFNGRYGGWVRELEIGTSVGILEWMEGKVGWRLWELEAIGVDGHYEHVRIDLSGPVVGVGVRF